MNLLSNETYPSVTMDPAARFGLGWKEDTMLIGKPLTDKKIIQYEKRGFYSEEFREQRRQFQAKKKARKRVGNFVEAEDGRFIYSPI